LVTTCRYYCYGYGYCYYCGPDQRVPVALLLFTRLSLLLLRQLLPTAVRRCRNGPTENIPSQRRRVGVSTNGKKTACSLDCNFNRGISSHFTHLQPTFLAAMRCNGQGLVHVVRDLSMMFGSRYIPRRPFRREHDSNSWFLIMMMEHMSADQMLHQQWIEAGSAPSDLLRVAPVNGVNISTACEVATAKPITACQLLEGNCCDDYLLRNKQFGIPRLSCHGRIGARPLVTLSTCCLCKARHL
jgi:hypothetical protein